VLIIRRSNLYYTASGIVTPMGGRPVYWLREDSSLNLCTGRPPTGVMISYVVQYNFDLLKMSTYCSKHVGAYNKLIIYKIVCVKLVNYWDVTVCLIRENVPDIWGGVGI